MFSILSQRVVELIEFWWVAYVIITIVAQIFSVLQATHVRTLQSAETGAQGSNARTALWDIQAILWRGLDSIMYRNK